MIDSVNDLTVHGVGLERSIKSYPRDSLIDAFEVGARRSSSMYLYSANIPLVPEGGADEWRYNHTLQQIHTPFCEACGLAIHTIFKRTHLPLCEQCESHLGDKDNDFVLDSIKYGTGVLGFSPLFDVDKQTDVLASWDKLITRTHSHTSDPLVRGLMLGIQHLDIGRDLL